jgi:hypothetical protein
VLLERAGLGKMALISMLTCLNFITSLFNLGGILEGEYNGLSMET